MAGIHEILQQYWGYTAFRPGQEEPIRSALAGNDTLLLLPTGGGKSICFQVPALASGKLCIVVTPLIALMKDQVDQLKKRGIRAAALHSALTHREIDVVLDNCIYGQVSFLYVSPERLGTELMRERTKKMKIGLLAIDEAHCISQWGYDFRPSYLKIPEFRSLIPDVPVMAVTASATREVQADILEKLGIPQANVFRRTFARPNLSYSVFKTESKEAQLLKLLSGVAGSAIVYVRTRKRTGLIAAWLTKQGIAAAAYHAGLSPTDRAGRQQAWISGQVRVMVATNAFGMGIDKANVRVVAHWDLPESLEAYYQEAGRAGRDGLKAFAVALYYEDDLTRLQASVQQKYPETDFVKRIYQALANYFRIPIGGGNLESFGFELDRFCTTYNLPRTETFHAVRFLEQEGFLALNEAFNDSSRAILLVDKTGLYEFQLKNYHYDTFIKRLMRFYGGEIFTQYVNLSEEALARSLKCPVADVYKGLEFLSSRNIIDYRMKQEMPRIQLLTPRYEADRLPIQAYAVKKRQEKDTAKIDAVVDYARHPAQCRSIMLLQYFDEQDVSYCGICDHCIQRKKNGPDHSRPQIAAAIREHLLKHSKASPNELRLLFPETELSDFSAALHLLVEKETLIYDHTGYLQLNVSNQ
ncbi:RecQ family ATP-dependent DNA helicase [Ravibacter arvi]|uniref:ATP-dependent DNA helicase RecQ n=1 Tax=Ravibacter arvi TaxID=2051041 RepID=A0ABP8M7I2_9BACT